VTEEKRQRAKRGSIVGTMAPLSLTAEDVAALEELRAAWDCSYTEVVRRALQVALERLGKRR
jgi:hypothetical protein